MKEDVQRILSQADIRIGGERPWDIQVHDRRLYRRVLGGGALAFGESYMDGWWDADALDEAICRLRAGDLENAVRSWQMAWMVLKAKALNLQSRERAYEVGEWHYDLGNDLFEKMLDRRMIYSCGYWRDAETLDEAQEAKLDLICRKLGLKEGDRLLDIGCGWGGLARFAAEEYGAEVVGITISKEQAQLGRERCAGLPIEIRLQDYRDLKETFDHVASVGMFEHVGVKNYETYFGVVRRVLKPGGLFLLHTIGASGNTPTADPWLNKYIFPNGSAPSALQVTRTLGKKFVLEDWHAFGADYDRTLMAWHANISGQWDALGSAYDERFRRMWYYFLLATAGGFRARKNFLWQLVLSPEGVPGGYRSVR
jgi:cyclopropane-fatty-acyl-phospholipid synthase